MKIHKNSMFTNPYLMLTLVIIVFFFAACGRSTADNGSSGNNNTNSENQLSVKEICKKICTKEKDCWDSGLNVDECTKECSVSLKVDAQSEEFWDCVAQNLTCAEVQSQEKLDILFYDTCGALVQE
jgi:hypothetical protein